LVVIDISELAAEGDEPLCVQFVNTVGARLTKEPSEYLHDTEELKLWLLRRKLVSATTEVDARDRKRALKLREAIYASLMELAGGRPIAAQVADALNVELKEALSMVRVRSDGALELCETDPVARALMILAISAADVMSSVQDRVRMCANEDCGWIFIDRSRNQIRRWCSMSDCGNLAKARKFQRKKAKTAKAVDKDQTGPPSA
jgi:predicted RNA-binding Zn ribbon-like protein